MIAFQETLQQHRREFGRYLSRLVWIQLKVWMLKIVVSVRTAGKLERNNNTISCLLIAKTSVHKWISIDDNKRQPHTQITVKIDDV